MGVITKYFDNKEFNIGTKFVDDTMVRFILNRYYKNSDQAHGMQHVKEVVETAQHICEKLGYQYNIVIELGCLFHDAGSSNCHRRVHHYVAVNEFMDWVISMSPSMRPFTTDREIGMICECILNHRSANKDIDKCSIEAQIVNAADYGVPSTTEESVKERMLKRSVRYHMSTDWSKYPEAILDARKHLKEKYGRNGYAQFSKLYIDTFGEDLSKQRELVERCYTEEWDVENY